jgi:DeoR/GlpR family transcriptional regulator of sugar metabolism
VRDGLLLKSHGGAILNEHLLLEPSFAEREDQWIDEKQAIAQAAAALIMGRNYDGHDFEPHGQAAMEGQRLTSIINAVNIATELMHADGVNVFLTGGNIRCRTRTQQAKLSGCVTKALR